MAIPLIETFASYVPRLTIHRLVANPTPITEPLSESFSAAVLYADISGFTALTERLANRGPAGAETLTRELNSYFGQLIEIITAYGGDIVKFAGDALIAIWPVTGDNSDLSGMAQQSAICALAIQSTLTGYKTADDLPLALSIGLGLGNIAMVYVGGVYSRWEFLITGPPLNQANQAEAQAGPDEIVLSPEVWALLQSHATGQPAANGYIRLTAVNTKTASPLTPSIILPPDIEISLRAYIPGAILSRLTVGQSGWLAELRRVTILFVNLPDLTYATPLEQGHTATKALQSALYHYEGSVNKISVDDKGATLVAALGLPPFAHEDDPIRGVRAALEMQAALQALNWRCAIGVTSGRAFCGSVGNETRREYTMIGDVVNLAARLMQAAGKNSSNLDLPILCDETTHQLAQNEITFATLSPISVKGKAGLIPIYRPSPQIGSFQSKIKDSTSKSEMVGRAAERMALADALQQLLRGQSHVVIIEGEAGIGKSRLVEDLLRQARTLNVNALMGFGDAVEKSTPHHAWRPVFSRLFGLDEQTDDTGTLQALAQTQVEAVDPDLLRLFPLLNAVLPLNLPENDLTTQMNGEVRADNTHDLLLHLLRAAAAQSPRLLVIEDAHWLDSASWALLQRVSQEIHPLLIVTATRPMTGHIPKEYDRLRNTTNARCLQLEALPLKDVSTLICQRLGVTDLPKPVMNLIHQKAEGHPFFSEELAYALRDTGLIEITNGICRLTSESSDFNSLDFPNTIEGVITSRIDRLTPQQQLTLKAASVIGRIFAWRILRDVHPIEADKPDLNAHLDALERLDLTPLETPEPELSYIFKHVITQEVAYNLMAFVQRRRLHQAVAEWFEHHHAEDLSPYYPLLAHHWRNALGDQTGDPALIAKTVEYLEKAGEQSLHNFANREATDFFADLLNLDDRLGNRAGFLQRARWERRLGEAYFRLGDWEEGKKHLEAALALLNHPVPTTGASMIGNILLQITKQTIYRLRSTMPLAHTHLSQQEREVMLEASRAYRALWLISYYREEVVQVTHVSLSSANLAEKIGPSPELLQGFASLCGGLGVVPIHPLAQAYIRWTLKMMQEIEDLSAKAYTTLMIGYYKFHIGHWAEARILLEAGSAMCAQIGYRRQWDELTGTLGVLHHRWGKFKEGKKYFADVYVSANRRGDVQPQIWALNGQVENGIWLTNNPGELLPYLEEAKSLLTAKNLSLAESIRTYGMMARVYLRQEEYELAQQNAQKVLVLSTQTQFIIFYAIEGFTALVEVYLTFWENGYHITGETIPKTAWQGLKIARKIGRMFPIHAPRAWYYQGRYDWLSGKHRQARKAWQKSLTLAEQLDMPQEQGLAHYEIGRHLPANDPNRQKHLNCAVEIFTQLEAAYDLARTQEELNRVAIG